MERSARIGILGGGPSGLSVANALAARGYTRVTVLEGSDQVGGQVRSIPYACPDGRVLHYELGARQPFGSRRLLELAAEFGLQPRPPIPIQLWTAPESTAEMVLDAYQYGRRVGPQKVRDVLQLIRALWPYRALARPGLTRVAEHPDLSMSWRQWIARLPVSNRDVLEALTLPGISGGHVASLEEITALKGIQSLFTILKRPHHYLTGRYSAIEGGYQQIWTRLAERLDVRTNHAVTRVIRSDDAVEVHTAHARFAFDAVVVATNVDVLALLDATAEESSAFEAVRYTPVWSAGVVCDTVPGSAYVFFDHFLRRGEPALSFLPCGTVSPGKTLYAVGYGHSAEVARAEAAEAAIRGALRGYYGVEVHEVHRIKLWRQYQAQYFADGVRDRLHHRLEALQGVRRTYYANEILHGSSGGRALEYAEDLVARCFAV